MRKVVLSFLIISLITGCLIEVTLRLIPGTIPLFLLQHFQDDLRLQIAEERGLPNRLSVRELLRDDGGPMLRTYLPQINLQIPFDDSGAVNSLQMDENGFCNPVENPYDKKHIDIVTIGDSFTFCTAVHPHQTWSAELSRLTNLSVYNLGIPGIGPYEYLQLLKHFGLKKKPDMVILNIYEGNDLRDAYQYHNYKQEMDSIVPSTTYRFIRQALNASIVKDSYVANLTISVLIEAGKAIYPPISEGSRHNNTKLEGINFRYDLDFGEGTIPFNTKNTDKDEVVFALLLNRKAIVLKPFEGALLSFVQLARLHGFIPVVAYTPSAFTAYSDFVRFEDESLTTVMPNYSRTLRQYISAGAKSFGYNFIDFTLPLQDIGRALRSTQLTYFPANVHLTMQGNRVVANALRDYVIGLCQVRLRNHISEKGLCNELNNRSVPIS